MYLSTVFVSVLFSFLSGTKNFKTPGTNLISLRQQAKVDGSSAELILHVNNFPGVKVSCPMCELSLLSLLWEKSANVLSDVS